LGIRPISKKLAITISPVNDPDVLDVIENDIELVDQYMDDLEDELEDLDIFADEMNTQITQIVSDRLEQLYIFPCIKNILNILTGKVKVKPKKTGRMVTELTLLYLLREMLSNPIISGTILKLIYAQVKLGRKLNSFLIVGVFRELLFLSMCDINTKGLNNILMEIVKYIDKTGIDAKLIDNILSYVDILIESIIQIPKKKNVIEI
jgi:hypothetical protein